MKSLSSVLNLRPVEFFNKLKMHSEVLLPVEVGVGLLTVYNSSSSAETDFSILVTQNVYFYSTP